MPLSFVQAMTALTLTSKQVNSLMLYTRFEDLSIYYA